MTSKLDILSQPKLVFLKKHVLAPTNRLGSCTKTVVERDKIESDFFQMISLCHEIDPKTTRRHQKNTSHRLFVDGNKPRFSCHKPRKCCPYRRNALKLKKKRPGGLPSLLCLPKNSQKKRPRKKTNPRPPTHQPQPSTACPQRYSRDDIRRPSRQSAFFTFCHRIEIKRYTAIQILFVNFAAYYKLNFSLIYGTR